MATTEEEKKKNEQPDAVEQAISDLESRAKERREFAASPVNIDTSGQPNWMGKLEEVRREYMESPEQKAAREKRERTNRRIAAISDGLVALSNVAGAMGGATPIKPASLSEAHRAAVERAAKRRRENAARFETAQRYYSGLQYKQDKDNADRYNDEVKARLDAGKEADDLIGEAARLRQTKANADRADERARQRQQEQERHNRESEATARIRAAKTGSSRSGGSGNTQADYDEYARWEREHPDEVNQIRQDNAQIDPYTRLPEKGVTSTTVKLVNAKMRQKYGSPSGGGKKKVSGFGGSQSSGKKKIAGFGK